MEYQHIPVMMAEALKYLNIKESRNYIDCTLGGAAYTLAIARAIGKKGKVVAIDLDRAAIENARVKIKEAGLKNVVLVEDNFKNLKEIARKNFSKKEEIAGIVFDLGLSSFHLADSSRGFSFRSDAPLDMAFGSKIENSSVDIINNYSLEDLIRIFEDYGEEKYAYKIAREVVNYRKAQEIRTTQQLANIVTSQYPKRHHYKINPATKVFQALRIETNEEFKNLELALVGAQDVLRHTGRLVVVSFHSGEDRIVKKFLKDNENLMSLSKRPIAVSDQEASSNPRARSAKLRAAIKIVE